VLRRWWWGLKKRATICSRKSHPVTFGRGGGIGEKSGRMRCTASFPSMCLKRPTNAQQSPIKSKMTTHGVGALHHHHHQSLSYFLSLSLSLFKSQLLLLDVVVAD
jgi:hypothetical protein